MAHQAHLQILFGWFSYHAAVFQRYIELLSIILITERVIDCLAALYRNKAGLLLSSFMLIDFG
jgi:hypothetical protein